MICVKGLSKRIIYINGLLYVAGAIFHLLFWRLFDWSEELVKLSEINSAIMQVLNLALAFVLIMAAYIFFFHWRELINTQLGRALIISWSLFWVIRAVNQAVFFGTDPSSIMTAVFFTAVAASLWFVLYNGKRGDISG